MIIIQWLSSLEIQKAENVEDAFKSELFQSGVQKIIKTYQKWIILLFDC